MAESPTGRGYVQGSDSYRQDDADREEAERRRMALERARKAVGVPCPYCGQSSFGMDVDRCPVHGVGCT